MLERKRSLETIRMHEAKSTDHVKPIYETKTTFETVRMLEIETTCEIIRMLETKTTLAFITTWNLRRLWNMYI